MAQPYKDDEIVLVEDEAPPAVLPREEYDHQQVSSGDVNVNFVENTVISGEEDATVVEESSTTKDTPVYYTTENGVKIVQGRVVVTRPDGTKYIRTPVAPVPDPNAPPERQVKKKDLKFLMVFSIVAILLFFPTGIPALVYARITSVQYYKGIENNDMTAAKKSSKHCERLIILSLVAGLLTYAIVFAVIERASLADHYHMSSFGTLGHHPRP